MGFASHLRGQIERVQREVSYKINHVFFLAATYAVRKSPKVGEGPYVSGHFINNWFPAVNTWSVETDNSRDPDGKASLERIAAIVKANTFYKKDGFLTLSNNVDYSLRVEVWGWPKGYDPKTGWNWTGKRIIYAPVAKTALYMKTIA